ncbi:Na(+)-translocating NADH-quinone reductase subunit A [Flavobacteriaceae bacterium Ap0902]|nr:Na(+)-translocating NADH-quinone reductase subunit A [Flavobacteriaceae bacterium Ap0902]
MSKDIKIRKGLDIKLVGAAEKKLRETQVSATYGLVPDDLHGVIPRLLKRDGDKVLAGEGVYYAKRDERIIIPSPVSGTIKEVVRGEKRKILTVLIEPDKVQESVQHDFSGWQNASDEDLKDKLCQAGAWPFIKQRPYDVIANPEHTPKAIFISAYNSAPIAADVDMLVQGREQFLQTGIDVLQKLTPGKIHVTLASDNNSSPFASLQNIELHRAKGPHPIGNVSVHIAQVDPMNAGEQVWVISPEHVAVIGELVTQGVLSFERIIAVNGSQVKDPGYAKVKLGAKIADIVDSFNLVQEENRYIQGNPLSGYKSSREDALGMYTNQLAVLEEGADYDFFGWTRPRPNKFSVYRALMFSFLNPGKKYNLNANTNGEERAFVLNGVYEEVFPLDIYPVQLMKSCLYRDIDEMEKLGIYEVAPEDFALTEFVCVSKLPHQKIIREGLDQMIREVG